MAVSDVVPSMELVNGAYVIKSKYKPPSWVDTTMLEAALADFTPGGGGIIPVIFNEATGSWPSYSTDPNVVRQFSSPADAPAPAHYNAADTWARRSV